MCGLSRQEDGASQDGHGISLGVDYSFLFSWTPQFFLHGASSYGS